jgi:hypothetical protein
MTWARRTPDSPARTRSHVGPAGAHGELSRSLVRHRVLRRGDERTDLPRLRLVPLRRSGGGGLADRHRPYLPMEAGSQIFIAVNRDPNSLGA